MSTPKKKHNIKKNHNIPKKKQAFYAIKSHPGVFFLVSNIGTFLSFMIKVGYRAFGLLPLSCK